MHRTASNPARHPVPWARSTITLALPLTVALAACGSDNPPPGEVYRNGSGALQESRLGASLGGTTLQVSMPVTKLAGEHVAMTLSARVLDLTKDGEPVVASASRVVDQVQPTETHVLELTGLPDGLDRSKTAGYVIAWSVKLPKGELRGRKSLYAALGKLEVQLKGSTDIPESGTVPFRIIVRDPDSLAPKSGAEVSAVLEGADGAAPTALFSGVTDDEGEYLALLALPAGVEEGAVRVDVRAGDAEAWARANARIVHDRKLSLSTDKTIYKPGQTIELRTLALAGADKTPIAGEEVIFEALDGKGNKVFKRRATTDDFGVASMRLPTDTEVNEGEWTLRAELGTVRTEKKLPVQRYNLPKMKVAVTTEREFALPGDVITGRVDARYVFGLPVTNAQVQLALQLSDGSVLQSSSASTDENGLLSFALNVPTTLSGEQLEEGRLAVVVAAEVTDGAGQKETGAAALPLARSELVIKALTEAGALVPGVENIVYLMVGDPVGRPISATLTIDGAGPLAPLTTDAEGVAELRFTPAADATTVDLTITARDGASRSHARSLSLAARASGLVLVRTDSAVYAAGDTATVRVIAPRTIARVYLDVFQGAAGLESRTVDLVDGEGEVLFAIDREMRGVLLFDAFALAGSGSVIRGAARVLVDPEDRLDISLVSDQAEYAPGEDARVTVTVRDAAGAPQVASLGLTAVDEAVFALGGEPDDDLRAFFNLDRKVIPSDLRVLGRSPAELFSARDPASEERFARLMFAAAKNVATPGVDYNSIREELPAVKTSVETKVKRDVVTFLKTLMPEANRAAQSGDFGEEFARDFVEPLAKRLLDPFGQLYRASLGENGQWYMLNFVSAGVDESFGTADDVSVQMYYQWIGWGDAASVDADGDWLAGGFDDGAEAFPGAPPAPNAGQGPTRDAGEAGEKAGAVKVRSDFRETVFVSPTLITDATGRATVSFPLADSITTWRMTAHGSTQNGKIGAARANFRTFQDFFIDFDVPTTLTKGDVVELSAVVYNYLSTPANVAVTLEPAPWITILSGAEQTVALGPSEVRSVKFTIRAERAGTHQLSLRGSAGDVADALVREARVMPDGVVEDQSFSDQINGTREHVITVPADAVEGGTRVSLTLTPGFGAEAVSGTEALLGEPTGCFEQTTSTAWPNTMVTTYLDTTGQMTPELRETAIGLVTRGYQRLLTFESPTGGFNWWGDNDPGNRILSAIMLWHLKDMEPVIETDPAVRDRTLAWLLSTQRADGSWPSGDALHAGNETLGTSDIRTTAFIAWALAHTGWADQAVERAATWLRANQPDASDLYANALAANALAKIAPRDAVTSTLLSRLDDLKVGAGDGRVKWPTETPSWTGTSGDVAAIETTSLVAYGLMQADAYPENAAGAMRFIIANKDAVGSWYNTQATMNALRALLAAASPRGSDAEGALTITVNGQVLPAVAITREDGDVYREVDLTGYVHAGDNVVKVEMAGTGDLSYRLSRRAYRPRAAVTPGASELALTVSYDRSTVNVGEMVRANVSAVYTGAGVRDQVIVRVGRAPGFEPRGEDLAAIVADGRAERFEVDERSVTFYMMGVQANVARDLSFQFVPTIAVEALAPPSVIYAYYEPSIRSELAPIAVTVRAP
ncbi:MG2 domain-containing protein [Myxococcota bacterium]|nr:MG2 domain-containing protein [Myxococcota bacterium]